MQRNWPISSSSLQQLYSPRSKTMKWPALFYNLSTAIEIGNILCLYDLALKCVCVALTWCVSVYMAQRLSTDPDMVRMCMPYM